MYSTQIKSFRSTPKYFEDWLNKTLRPPREIKTDGGTYLIKIPAVKISDTLLVIHAYCLPDDEQPRIEYRNGMYYQFEIDKDPQLKEIILFDITLLSDKDELIKVKVQWPDPAIEPYIREILKVRSVDWQETDERQVQETKRPDEASNEPKNMPEVIPQLKNMSKRKQSL
jgi:hypothetical protein